MILQVTHEYNHACLCSSDRQNWNNLDKTMQTRLDWNKLDKDKKYWCGVNLSELELTGLDRMRLDRLY